jgi:integrase
MTKRSNGEGSIWKRADGRWCGAYFVPRPGGTGRVRKYVCGRTRKEVYDKLTAVSRNVRDGVPVPVGGQTLEAYLAEWLAQVAAVRVRPSTLRSYDMNVRLHIVPRIGRRQLGKLTARDVRQMLDDMRGNGAGPRVVQHVHATLRVALEHAVREELLPRNVAKLVQVAPPPREEREPLTVEEAQTLLKAARDDRLHALYVATLLLGMRRSEALALRWPDVDLGEGVLTIRRTVHRVAGEGLVTLPTKTRKSARTVPLPPAVVDALRRHRERQAAEADAGGWIERDLVFMTPRGTAIDPRNFSRMFGELCDRAGVRRVRLHDLRHTCVTLLLQLGVPPRVVMEIVGHSTLEMTMRVYGHVSLDAQRNALGQLGDLLGQDEE